MIPGIPMEHIIHSWQAAGFLPHTNFVAIDGISTGALWGGTRDDLYTVTTPAYTDTDMMVEFAKTMKEWDNIGVWRTDVLNVGSTTARDDYRVGKTAADQHHTQTWTDLVSLPARIRFIRMILTQNPVSSISVKRQET